MTIIMAQICFSNIEEFIRINIASAKKRIYVAVAWFTNDVLFKELLRALNRKVEIKIILHDDILNRGEFGLDFGALIGNNVDLYFTNSSRGMMHHKFCIIDNTVITGSYNWTYQANVNDENIVLLEEQDIVNSYCEQFEKLLTICDSTKLPYEHLKWTEIKDGDFTEIRRNLIRDVRCQHDYNSKQKEEKLIKLNEAYMSGNVDELVVASSLPIISYCGFDQRGVPILKKEWKPEKTCYWLNNISIGVVPMGRPHAGRKFVHAKYTSNDVSIEDKWVDIFDSEYVDEVLKYFHKKEGGWIDDSLPLPEIPEEIYNTRSKYIFKEIWYAFNEYGLYGAERKRIGNDGKYLVNKEGKPYVYKSFETLIRYDKDNDKYIEFDSMTELCHLIVQSLFDPNGVDDYDYIGDYSCVSGVFRASIDDLRKICALEGLKGKSSPVQSAIDVLKEKIKTKPDCFWIHKEDGQIYSYAFGTYINKTYSYDACLNSYSGKNENWFKLIRIQASPVNYGNNKFDALLKRIIEDIKTQGKKGIVYECLNQQVSYFEKYGFIRESVKAALNKKNTCLLKLSFT